MLTQTLCAVWQRAVHLDELEQLIIHLYQEGADQRVWQARATLTDGTQQFFGLIVARGPGASSDLTSRDFRHLTQLYDQQPAYCVAPYVQGTLPGGVSAYAVEWLDQHKELVFEISRDGGVFLVNAVGAHQILTPQLSRRIWRKMMTIMWSYPELDGINIQAGDFVGKLSDDGTDIDLKLTTARDSRPRPTPAAHIHAILGTAITASGYLSTSQQPFDRDMSEPVFLHRMQAILKRRFGDQAVSLAQQQWDLFCRGAFAQQEDDLKEDCILATYDHLSTEHSESVAWQTTRHYWQSYAHAVQAGDLPPSWWFPATDIHPQLNALEARPDLW